MYPVSRVKDDLNACNDDYEVARKLDINVLTLRSKLKSARVIYDGEKKCWICISNDPEASLKRDIYKTIKILKIDRVVDAHMGKEKVNDSNENTLYELFKTYRSVESEKLIEKKSFFLTTETYKHIKRLSKENSLKINLLIHVLLEKGLEYYGLNDKDYLESNVVECHQRDNE